MKALVSENKTSEAKELLQQVNLLTDNPESVVDVGNPILSIILTEYRKRAEIESISFDYDVSVPNDWNISAVDAYIIIGNTLDNAIEACMKLDNPSDRFIRVYVDIFKEQLYISVQNSNGGKIKKIGKTYHTTKESNSHGFGLIRVDNIVNKYNGYINRQNEEGVFATEVMLPL